MEAAFTFPAKLQIIHFPVLRNCKLIEIHRQRRPAPSPSILGKPMQPVRVTVPQHALMMMIVMMMVMMVVMIMVIDDGDDDSGDDGDDDDGDGEDDGGDGDGDDDGEGDD